MTDSIRQAQIGPAMPGNIGSAQGQQARGVHERGAPDVGSALKSNALDALKPHYMPKGAPYRRAMFTGGDVGASERAIYDLGRTIDKRLDYKVKRLSSWLVRKFSNVAKRETDIKSLKAWKSAASDFGKAVGRYHELKQEHEAMRRMPIPHDEAARDDFLTKLEKNTHALHTAVLSVRRTHKEMRSLTNAREVLMDKTGVAITSKRRRDIVQARQLTEATMRGVVAGDLAEFQAATMALNRDKIGCLARLKQEVFDAARKGLMPTKIVKDVQRNLFSPTQILTALKNAPNKKEADKLRKNVFEPLLSNLITLETKLAARAPRPEDHMLNLIEDEHARIRSLHSSLDTAARGGDAALKAIIGDPKKNQSLQTGDALQALRSGEPLSPHLKDVYDGRTVIRRQPTKHGKGAFNTVYSTRLALPDDTGKVGPPKPYILKPLSGDIRSPSGGGPERKLAQHQTRAFSRQLAAHKLSKRMGLDLVAEPKLVRHDGKLCMAMPEVKGHTAHDWVKGIYATVHKDHAPKVLNALQNNKELQHKMKDVQLFHALSGNVDGHSNNLKIQFFDGQTGREYGPRELGQLGVGNKFDVIERLKVKVGLFDMDGAFTGVTDPSQEMQEPRQVVSPHPHQHGAFTAAMRKVPALSHGVGAPPFHTKEDYEKVSKLVADLDASGPARDDFGWCLTGDEARNPGPKSQEMNAMRERGRKLLEEMDAQYASGKRIDPKTSETVKLVTNDNGDRSELRTRDKHAEQKAIDNARSVATYKNGTWGYVVRKAAVIEKYFPLRAIYRT